ncbi:MAG: U32 family peptidase, partial [Eubacteriales bacterium]|nr:U32 family peptidase [Eubacteriales bacterium]
EVFVHGALCVCISGQCLFSSMVGGRSGNRGQCAQPCRLPYTLLKDGVAQASGYLLSPKDNCAVEYLEQLRAAGVASLKIEGRMKSPEYVATVVRVYRKYLDTPGPLDSADYKALLQAFNRGGFTPAYLNGWPGRDFICRERAKHWGVPIGTVLDADARRNQVRVLLSDDLALGDGVELDCPGFPGNIVTVIFQSGVPRSSAGAGDVVTIGNLHSARAGAALYKISDKAQDAAARRSYDRSYRRVPLSGRFSVTLGQPARLTLWDGDGHSVTQQGERPAEAARNRALRADDVRAQLVKTGDMPFVLQECAVDVPDALALPVSELNGLRRRALDRMLAVRSRRYPHRSEVSVPAAAYPAQGPADGALNAFFYQLRADTLAAAGAARRVCLPFAQAILPENLQLVSDMDFSVRQLLFWLPPEMPPALPAQLTRYAERLRRAGYTGALLGNLGQLTPLQKAGLPAYGDIGLNIFNSAAAQQIADLGFAGVTLSPELTLRQIQRVYHGNLSAEAVVYGRLPLMTSKHCPVGAEMGGGARCGLCGSGSFELQDRKGMRFALQCYADSCTCLILNAVKLHVPDFAARLCHSGVDHLRLYFADESADEIGALLAQYAHALVAPPERFTRGQDYTAGHYLRGV